MNIRPEEPSDRAAIHAVNEAAFPSTLEANLVDQLRSDGDAIVSLVAVEDGTVVGHAMFSRMASEFPALGLGPVAVVPAQQRKGIGEQLIRRGIAMAKGAAWEMIFVLGDEAYYERFGFDPALASGFTSPYAGPHFMALYLTPSRARTSGAVDYAPAFKSAGD